MSIPSTAHNYFRSAAQVGIRQKVARRRALDLPGGVLLWKASAKILVWVLPVVLGLNLWCATSIDSARARHDALEQSVLNLQNSGRELVVQRDRLLSPVRVKIAAAGKLSLFEPAPGQIQRM